MGKFTKEFKENSIAWIAITTIAALIGGFASSWLTYRYVKRQEIVDTVIAELDKTREVSKIEEERGRNERVRKEVVRWANPILETETSLQGRLHNILEQGGDQPLASNYRPNPNWSISHEYFLNSTLFLFGQYFSWIQMLKEELNFELFQSQEKKDELFEKIQKVSDALANFPPDYECEGADVQVFELQQRAMGELIMERRADGSRTVMSYPDFVKKLDDPAFRKHFEPLKVLLKDIKQEDQCRWKRIAQTRDALADLQKSCQNLLNIAKK